MLANAWHTVGIQFIWHMREICIILLQLNYNYSVGILPMGPTAWQPRYSTNLTDLKSSTKCRIWDRATHPGRINKRLGGVMIPVSGQLARVLFSHKEKRFHISHNYLCFIACIHRFFVFLGHESGPFWNGHLPHKRSKKYNSRFFFRILSTFKSQAQSIYLIHLLY